MGKKDELNNLDPKTTQFPPAAQTQKSETPLAKQPTLSEADKRQMYGDLGAEDISVPRIVVLQGLSPEVADGLGKPGNLFVKGLNRELGKELEIVPLLRNRNRIRWRPLPEGGGILCQAFDGKTGQGDPGGNCAVCPKKDWVGGMGPECDLYENVILVIRSDEDWIPMALSGSRTKLKAMRDLNTLFMAEMMKNRPLFMKSYTVRVVEKTNKSNLRYFTFRMFPGNNNAVLPDSEIQKAKVLYDSVKDKNLVVDQTDEQTQPEINAEL